MRDDAPQGNGKQKWEKKWEIHYEACITDPKACCLVDGKRKDYDGYQGHFAPHGAPLPRQRVGRW